MPLSTSSENLDNTDPGADETFFQGQNNSGHSPPEATLFSRSGVFAFVCRKIKFDIVGSPGPKKSVLSSARF
jgi:hypothetical protein